MVHDITIEHAIGPCEVHVLEDAARTPSWFNPLLGLETVGADLDDLARLDIAHESGTDRIESAGFARDNPSAVIWQLPNRKWTNAVRIAKGVERRRRGQHDGIGAVQLLHHKPNARPNMPSAARIDAYRACCHLAIGVPVELDALVGKPSALRQRVDKRPIVRERN